MASKDRIQRQNNSLQRKKTKRWLRILLALLIFVSGCLGVLQWGVYYTETHWEHWYPDYEKIDLQPILDKETLSEEDYETLYRQTGLTRLAIDDMLAENNTADIIQIQNFLFKRQEVQIRRFNPFTYMEEIDDYAIFTTLRDGDIIVSATTRVSWWRYGHAALVVDGKKELLLESFGPGEKSEYSDAATFTYLANFMVLRPKADEETKKQIVDYANTNLVGLPYRFSIGVFYKKYKEKITRTQCAHLVWYAYKKFGIDLDSNGGAIVKPQDIALSPHVELVQAYGFHLDRLWTKQNVSPKEFS